MDSHVRTSKTRPKSAETIVNGDDINRKKIIWSDESEQELDPIHVGCAQRWNRNTREETRSGWKCYKDKSENILVLGRTSAARSRTESWLWVLSLR